MFPPQQYFRSVSIQATAVKCRYLNEQLEKMHDLNNYLAYQPLEFEPPFPMQEIKIPRYRGIFISIAYLSSAA